MDWYGRLSLHTAFPNFKRVILFPLFRSYPHFHAKLSTGTQYITSSKMAQAAPSYLFWVKISFFAFLQGIANSPTRLNDPSLTVWPPWYPSWHGITLSRGGPLCWRLLCWLKVQMLLASTKHRIKSSNTRKNAGNMMTFQPANFRLPLIFHTSNT